MNIADGTNATHSGTKAAQGERDGGDGELWCLPKVGTRPTGSEYSSVSDSKTRDYNRIR